MSTSPSLKWRSSLGDVPVTGTVGGVVVDVEVVVANVVVVGSPVIRTTGGCTVTATIDKSERI